MNQPHEEEQKSDDQKYVVGDYLIGVLDEGLLVESLEEDVEVVFGGILKHNSNHPVRINQGLFSDQVINGDLLGLRVVFDLDDSQEVGEVFLRELVFQTKSEGSEVLGEALLGI